MSVASEDDRSATAFATASGQCTSSSSSAAPASISLATVAASLTATEASFSSSALSALSMDISLPTVAASFTATDPSAIPPRADGTLISVMPAGVCGSMDVDAPSGWSEHIDSGTKRDRNDEAREEVGVISSLSDGTVQQLQSRKRRKLQGESYVRDAVVDYWIDSYSH